MFNSRKIKSRDSIWNGISLSRSFKTSYINFAKMDKKPNLMLVLNDLCIALEEWEKDTKSKKLIIESPIMINKKGEIRKPLRKIFKNCEVQKIGLRRKLKYFNATFNIRTMPCDLKKIFKYKKTGFCILHKIEV